MYIYIYVYIYIYICRMLSLQKPHVNFLSFEKIDILLKMKLYSIGNLSNCQFEL